MRFLYQHQGQWRIVEAFDKKPQRLPNKNSDWDVTDLEVRMDNHAIMLCMKSEFFSKAIPLPESIFRRMIV